MKASLSTNLSKHFKKDAHNEQGSAYGVHSTWKTEQKHQRHKFDAFTPKKAVTGNNTNLNNNIATSCCIVVGDGLPGGEGVERGLRVCNLHRTPHSIPQ